MIDLQKDVKYIKGVGPKKVLLLNLLGIKSVEDIEALIYPADDLYKRLGVDRLADPENKAVFDEVSSIVAKVNKNFQSYSHISKITILKEPLEMTTTLKVKRNYNK